MNPTTIPSLLPLRDLSSLEVRLVTAQERARWDALMREHHYLSFGWMAGESLRHVALLEGEWVALLGWASSALKGTLRDRFIGWSPEIQYRRLRYLANNVRYLLLPSGRVRNLASKALARSVRRLSADWQSVHGHPIHLLETFVDPSRFAGTCYRAAGWTCLGETRGFGYKSGVYHRHNQPKTVWIRLLTKNAPEILRDPADTPLLKGAPPMTVSLDCLPLEGVQGLWRCLDALDDPRKKKGVRHPLPLLLRILVTGILTGCTNVMALGEWSKHLASEQDLLKRLGGFFSPSRERYVPPSWTTLHRTVAGIDPGALEKALTLWAQGIADPSEPLAVDGKAVRGSATETRKAIHLLSAFFRISGLVLAQKEISEKTNEIPELKNLLRPLPLGGRTVTSQACNLVTFSFRLVVAGLEPDKGALSDKEMARIKAVAGPYGTGRDPPDGDKMVTIFSWGKS